MSYFVIALVLGLSQCKKEQTNNQNTESHLVPITLNVNGGNSNSRVIVDPAGAEGYATFNFETNDVIYVGYNNACVGTLTYSDGTFSGLVEIPESNYGGKLHFYFLGGVGFTPTIDETNNTATVVISDQSSNYPVISYSPSNEAFTGAGPYSATLKNKCSIMKFTVADGTPSTTAICITGMNNKVTLNFNPEAEGTDEGFTYGINSDDGGLIKMPGVATGSTETWAIVLPQPALAAGSFGSAYTEDTDESNCYLGLRPSIIEIGSNQYIVSDVGTMTMDTPKYVNLSPLTTSYTAKNGQVLRGTTSYPISITAGATVTLDGVNITNSSSSNGAIYCNGGGTTTLVLSGENTANSSSRDNTPGVRVQGSGTLVIRGDGSLTATGGSYAAGIGGGGYTCGNIVIQGGTITANGGYSGAGIGSGNFSCGSITINGGTVVATGGSSAPGISTYAPITINDGRVTATAGTGTAAGIGSGSQDLGNNCAINITGGTFIATGGSSGGAGIGTGNGQLGSNINISGGNVTAIGVKDSAGIGRGSGAFNANINISGGIIYAKGTTACAIGPSINGDHGGAIVITSGVQSITAVITTNKAKCIGAAKTYGKYSESVTIDGHTYSTRSTGTFDPTGDVGNTSAFTGTYDSGTKTYTLTHK